MSRLTAMSLTHRTVALLLSLLTIGLGVFTMGALKQELIPSIDLPRASILTIYPGASPQAVEREVSKPIESAVKTVSGVKDITSKSSSGVSQVTMQWEYGLDADKMGNDLRSAVDSIKATLPSGVTPQVVTGSFDDIPIVILAVSSRDSTTVLSQKVKDTVAPALKAVAGVREVTTGGEEKREVVITLDQKKVTKYGIDQTLLASSFSSNASAVPSGTIRTGAENLDVQVGTTWSSLDDVKHLLVQGTDGPVMLEDFATVREQPVETTTISRVNGKPSLTLSITKDASGNTVSVAKAVAAVLPELEKRLGNGATFATVFDQAPFIEQSIHDLGVEGGIGLAMAIFVILLFLRSIRPTLITAISIPLSLFIALIGLWAGGYTLNILTLGALTVAIGRVVDDSIVVIENIKRHQGLGERGHDSIVGAVREVAGAVTSSTLTTVAVFLPIGLVGGQAGVMFRPFAITVTVSLLASLLVSLTVIPVLASWFMKPAAKNRPTQEEKDTWLQKAYVPVLHWALGHRVLTLLMAFAVFAGTLALAPRLKTDFIGEAGQTSLQITQTMPAGTGLAETDQAAHKIEALLAVEPTVQTYQTTIGGSTAVFMGSQADTNYASHAITLATHAKGVEVADRLRAQIADLGPGVGETEVVIGRSSSQIVLYVESSEPDKLKTANERVMAMLRGLNGLGNIKSDLAEARSMLKVDVDEQAAADRGMSQAQVGLAVTRAIRGQKVGTLTSGETTLDLMLRSQKPVKDIDELRSILLPVTTKMTVDARTKAADKVTARSDALQDDAKQAQTDAYNEQVKALRSSRSKAQSTLSSLQKQLSKLNRALEDASDATPVPVPDPIQGEVISGITQGLTVGQIAQQIAGVQAGIAGARAQISAADTQLTKLAESRTKTLDSQADQEAIVQAGKDAAKTKATAVRLTTVADVHLADAPAMITRVDGTRTATVTATPSGNDLGALTTAIKAGVKGLVLPDGVSVRIGGVSQQQQDSFAQLGLAMLVAIAVVYLIMVATFGSLLQPLILLVSIPFAATGAIGLSLITDTPLGIPSMIGLLMLIGIVVTNAIVLIDLINQYRERGTGIDRAIRDGARLRLRPIVMTALATIFALIPMGLGVTGGGVFISKPLAIVVIGGLVSSTFLTLILVPVLYDLVEKYRQRRAGRREERAVRREAAADVTAAGTGAEGVDDVGAGAAGPALFSGETTPAPVDESGSEPAP